MKTLIATLFISALASAHCITNGKPTTPIPPDCPGYVAPPPPVVVPKPTPPPVVPPVVYPTPPPPVTINIPPPTPSNDTVMHFAATCDVIRYGATYLSVPCNLDDGGTPLTNAVTGGRSVYPSGSYGSWSITLHLDSGPWPWQDAAMRLPQARTADYIKEELTPEGWLRHYALLWGQVTVKPVDATIKNFFASQYVALASQGIDSWETRCQNITVTQYASYAVVAFDESVHDSNGWYTPTEDWLTRYAQDMLAYSGAKRLTQQ